MSYLIAITIAGISISPLFSLIFTSFKDLHIWDAQGFFAQLMILVCFSWSFKDTNKWLGIFIFWAGIQTAFYSIDAIKNHTYVTPQFLTFFNVLCVALFYKSVEKLNPKQIGLCFDVLYWTTLVTLGVCVLQAFGLSQYFALTKTATKHDIFTFNNLVTGFIANGTHLAGMLGFLAPLFLIKSSVRNMLILCLIASILFFYTGTTKGDPSSTGIVVFFASILYCLISLKKYKYALGLFGFVTLTAICIFSLFGFNEMMVNDEGRFNLWKYYFGMLNQVGLTGGGLGLVKAIKALTPFPKAQHLHMEYLQVWIELGIIGLSILGFMIWDFFAIKTKCRTGVILKSIVFGGLLNALLIFPFHLWLTSMYLVFAYAGVYALKRYENIYEEISK